MKYVRMGTASNFGNMLSMAFASLFDIATFVVLLHGFGASAEVFRTAWFVESMATQILVVFLIRAALPAWISRPNQVLVASSLTALGAAIAIALTPIGRGLGFVALPWPILMSMAALVMGYLVAAEVFKRMASTNKIRRRHSSQ